MVDISVTRYFPKSVYINQMRENEKAFTESFQLVFYITIL